MTATNEINVNLFPSLLEVMFDRISRKSPLELIKSPYNGRIQPTENDDNCG